VQRPADFEVLVYGTGLPDADVRTRTWLCALAATSDLFDASWQAMENAWLPRPAGMIGMREFANRAFWELSPGLSEPVSIAGLLDLGRRTDTGTPGPGVFKRALDTGEILRARLSELDERLAQDRTDLDALAALGIASLDLGRVELEAGRSATLLLFEGVPSASMRRG